MLIDHVGSSAVGIGGKNIIDILIGGKNKKQMEIVRNKLSEMGYFEGNDTNPERIFMASKKKETGEGDFHIHICPISSDSYQDFLRLKDYLIKNRDEAKKYFNKKEEFAKKAGYNRNKYKQLKSAYVSKLLTKLKHQSAKKS